MKILTIVGARPQFIKAAAVSRAIATHNQHYPNQPVDEIIVHTGQHYDWNMSKVFFEQMQIPQPDYHLDIGGLSHGAMTGRMLEKIEAVILSEKPDLVLVYGDTNSTLAGALAAVKLHVPIAHVEAGLRSYNRRMPEEINRILTDHTSDLLFVPTDLAMENLRREGITEDRIHWVGDVMYDAALHYETKAQQHSKILHKLGLNDRNYILVTIHRAENTDNPQRLRAIFEGLTLVANEIPLVVPLHPRTKVALQREKMVKEKISSNIRLIEPVGYLDMVMLEKNARIIVTDSGGVQKEAFFYQVPCVTLRDETEWTELVDLGWNRVVVPISEVIVAEGIHQGLKSKAGSDAKPYGDGRSANRIIEILLAVT